MKTEKSLLWSAGAVVIAALLAATNVFAQLSCTSKTTKEETGNFIVNVVQTTFNGQRTYEYTMTNAPGKNGQPNKFFVYVKDGLDNDLSSTICAGDNCSPATYLNHNETLGGFPPEVWSVNNHEDGVGATNVAIDKVITLNVPERFKPEEAVTTVVLGIGSQYEHCGPIYGPTTPAAQEGFPGSPLVSTVSRKTFANGCVYDVTAGSTTNIVESMTPVTAYATVPPYEACTVDSNADCATDLGLAFCPPGELGRPPLQSVAGGICYYPPNLKFAC